VRRRQVHTRHQRAHQKLMWRVHLGPRPNRSAVLDWSTRTRLTREDLAPRTNRPTVSNVSNDVRAQNVWMRLGSRALLAAVLTCAGVGASPATAIALSPTAQQVAVDQSKLAGSATPTCSHATRQANLGELLHAFRHARLSDAGAGACLSRSAYDAYCHDHCAEAMRQDSPGPMCLYRCAHYRVRAISWEWSNRSRTVAHATIHATCITSDGRRYVDNEALTLRRHAGWSRIVSAAASS
jgi:hypothetical protein